MALPLIPNSTPFTPDTDVRLLNVPLANDGANTLWFESLLAQTDYFTGRTVQVFDDTSHYTYQRKDGILRVNHNAEDLWNVNYVMYRNSNFGSKWFYAFATIEYVNPSVTNIHLQTDYWQTFHFDFELGNCRVDREIIKKSNDKLFTNHLPEPIGYTNFALDSVRSGTYNQADFYVGGWVVASQVNLQESPAIRDGGNTYNGTYYPLSMYLSRGNDQVQLIIQAINRAYDNGVNYIQSIPKFASDALQTTEVVQGSNTGIISSRNYVTHKSFNLNLSSFLENDIIDGYDVRNRKCFNYTTLIATNNGGGGHEYELTEWFGPSTEEHSYEVEFRAYTNINEGCNVSFIPLGYKMASTADYNYDEGFNSQTYPTMGYIIEKSNYFQFQQQMADLRVEQSLETAQMNMVTGYADAATGLLTGGMAGKDFGGTAGLGTSIGGTKGMVGTAGQAWADRLAIHQQEERNSYMRQEQYLSTPYQFGGIAGSTSTAVCASYISPRFYFKVPLHDEIEAIDTYFDMYGYRVDKTKKPNFNQRSNWDYCQCKSVVFKTQNMPQEASEYISRCLTRGMTFWHKPGKIYDYSETNS